MQSKYLIIIIVIVCAVAAFLVFHYYFSIYEVVYLIEPQKKLFADNNSFLTIKAKPLNAFGVKAPFRNAPCKIKIIEGKDLIDIIELNENEGYIKIKAKNLTGTIIIQIKSKFALLPTEFQINIEPNLT
ncbi:MAG TPA: hypothetical protein VFF33_11720 [Ignavibacteriaceae bacterium]|nr:hypothetical protein [Ignavibacteriaceae bacterium]